MIDYPYVVLILILLLGAYEEWRYPSKSNLYFKIASLVVFIFVAFRAPVVGADTWNYYRYAIGVRNFYNVDDRDLEPLYLLYNSFFRDYCRVGLVFMVINAVLIFSPLYYILKKYVARKTFAVLAFFLFFDYSYYFVALRQLLALSIILWGVIYVIENRKQKWIVFALLSILAWFMHTTAAVVAPLFIIAYFLPMKSRIWAITAIGATAVLGIILQSFKISDAFNILLSVNYSATERVAGYLESFELNELSTLNITLRQSIIAFVAFSFISEDKVNHWFSKIYLIGICLHNLFISVPMINRMILANMIFVIIVFSWSFDLIRTNVKMKKVINVIMFVVVLYFTRVYIINQVGYDVQNTQRIHPYYFFFEDYHDHPSIKYF